MAAGDKTLVQQNFINNVAGVATVQSDVNSSEGIVGVTCKDNTAFPSNRPYDISGFEVRDTIIPGANHQCVTHPKPDGEDKYPSLMTAYAKTTSDLHEAEVQVTCADGAQLAGKLSQKSLDDARKIADDLRNKQNPGESPLTLDGSTAIALSLVAANVGDASCRDPKNSVIIPAKFSR